MFLRSHARDSIDANAASGFDSAAMQKQLLSLILLCGALGAAAAERLANPAKSTALFGDNVQFRGRLDNARAKFERQQQGTVAFIGG